ncbi:protein of unknown function [Magnetospirillum sp. XM-1]|nr:protein of unknown function [Magnetospirillum sp. XM-1]
MPQISQRVRGQPRALLVFPAAGMGAVPADISPQPNPPPAKPGEGA